ncbi:MAG: ATPase, partial [Clostridiaceae bacterium]|nr:ATPase [Clostridiaceae bacterium]
MMRPPPYFEHVRKTAARRWVQLEQDPVLAGPWHQLFKQVQSPRHVISELLQNADDAGATMASADIRNGEFVFIHNGEDFTEEHFTSLCRFGYSNKRSLHTIGFRGVGFKSTFSLGDEVRLRTPSLSVAFRRSRFTEPIWIDQNGTPASHTQVSVTIRDPHRLRELKKNLEDWAKSPASLLFFRSIRHLTISGIEIGWETQMEGPVPGSRWFSLTGTPDRQVLLIQSDPEPFPSEALDEIRQERMVALDEETDLPPCKVELVLCMKGRLFVILPTGVLTKLPFACNAPFIQDPARVKIKDPEISPTNRWLLDRAGKLAAGSLLRWVEKKDIEIKERCKAYTLLPDIDHDGDSLEGDCERFVEEAFKSELTDKPFLLLEDGSLAKGKGCVAVPQALLNIWPGDLVSNLFTDDAIPILSRHISARNRDKLINQESIDEIDKIDVLFTLKMEHPPKPDTWAQLLLLWDFVAEDIIGSRPTRNLEAVRILPVHGKDVLYAANEIVRLGEKRLLQSQEDWKFLSECLLVLNQNWPRFLAEQRLRAERSKNDSLLGQAASANRILDALDLGQASDVSQVIQQAAEKFFSKEGCDIEDCIRLAQLAATLGATVSESFQFVTRDGYRRPVSEQIVYDANNDLDAFLPDQWYQSHVLHKDYGVLLSCSGEEWRLWITSGRSQLLSFAPLQQMEKHEWDRSFVITLLKDRGLRGEPTFPYQRDDFTLEDWDFQEEHWTFWQETARRDPLIWGKAFSRILLAPKEYWTPFRGLKAWQNGTTYKRPLTNEALLPAWIAKFQSLPCLQDTNGRYREPAELYCRTRETDPLFGVEAFVRPEYDTEQTRPLLIKLGVRDTPTGPGRLLDRLRALATVESPPVYEVEKWCRRLDQLLSNCSTSELNEIKFAFADEKLILTAESEWGTTAEVFLAADEEDAPGAAIVHPAIQDLSMWRKLEIADRPTGDLAMHWLCSITSGIKLFRDELRRVRALLPRYPERIWRECNHWRNLEGEWTPVDQ